MGIFYPDCIDEGKISPSADVQNLNYISGVIYNIKKGNERTTKTS